MPSGLREATSRWIDRRSSGTKMLVIMAVALMPLGLIALFASIQSAHNKQLQHVNEARIVAAAEARQVELVLLRIANVIRPAAAGANVAPARCADMLARAKRALDGEVALELHAVNGTLLCASRLSSAELPSPPRQAMPLTVLLRRTPDLLHLSAAAADGAYAVTDIPAAALLDGLSADDDRQGLELVQGRTALTLITRPEARPSDKVLTVRVPILGGQALLITNTVASGVTAIEVLLIIMPLLMWAGAALIGWVVINELLLRPLGQLGRAVNAASQDGKLELPRLTSPALEIRELGAAFVEATDRIAHREVALEQAFDHQVKLTREVHHRVKNNLQVVASLINLHARGTSGDVQAAYASIQRRVDALAIVHRNHFAELEESRGVALRALVAELTANLRATAPPAASGMSIVLDMDTAHVSQDVAVPVAFLITEMVELVMTCAPTSRIDIALSPAAVPQRAILSVTAASLVSEACHAHPARERFDRIVTGLARQLRAPLEVDATSGRYDISIAVMIERATA